MFSCTMFSFGSTRNQFLCQKNCVKPCWEFLRRKDENFVIAPPTSRTQISRPMSNSCGDRTRFKLGCHFWILNLSLIFFVSQESGQGFIQIRYTLGGGVTCFLTSTSCFDWLALFHVVKLTSGLVGNVCKGKRMSYFGGLAANSLSRQRVWEWLKDFYLNFFR